VKGRAHYAALRDVGSGVGRTVNMGKCLAISMRIGSHPFHQSASFPQIEPASQGINPRPNSLWLCGRKGRQPRTARGLTAARTPMHLPRLLPIAVALLVAAGRCAVAADDKTDKAPAAGVVTMGPIEFYLAKGDADACGPGCNAWIAAEGKIDAGAASRLRRLLAKLGRARPPIYFHSPGGLVTGGLELGRLLHEQKLEVSFAHTVPIGCGKPQQPSCDTLKHSGKPVDAQLDPLVAMCNSACVYALAGGAVRHVPPLSKLGIHDVGLDPAAATPSRAAAREGKEIAHERIEDYLRGMGTDDGLFKAAFAIPFESKRFLERDEVVRFRIDRREFDESPWQLAVGQSTPILIKKFFARTDSSQVRYLEGAVTLNCAVGRGLRLGLLREHADVAGADSRPASIDLNGHRYELSDQSTSQAIIIRSTSLARKALDDIGDDATLGLTAADLARNDESAGSVTLSMRGFTAAFAKFRTSCDEAERTASNAWLQGVSGKTVPGSDVPGFGGLPHRRSRTE
jgi:hypothetical protein